MPDYTRLDRVVGEIVSRDSTMKPFLDALVEHEGKFFFRGTSVAEFLGYKTFDSFCSCISRAKFTAENSNRNVAEHFIDSTVFDSKLEVLLSPWALNATLMEADPKKKRVAIAKNYFATLASDVARGDEARLRERQVVRKNHKRLHGIAADIAGVSRPEQHAALDDAGYRGMYRMGVKEVERFKGVPPGEHLLDCADHTELAANSLRLAMAADKIAHNKIGTPAGANRAHAESGDTVRGAIERELGKPPERLALAPKTIDEISKAKAKELRTINALPA